MKQKFLIITLSSISLLLSSCAIYKVDVQQGNLVTQEMLDQLTLNMPAKKVRFIMGTPLLVDVFHQQRWDYVYSSQPGGEGREQRHISLLFDENQHLTRIMGDVKVNQQRTPKPAYSPEVFDSEPIL